MAEDTAISWTDSTFNPWWGCTKVSHACDFCYAEALDKRTGGEHWGPKAERRRTSENNRNEPRRWQKKADAFDAEHGHPRRVFCASMADVFDNQVPPEWRADLWNLIRECNRLDWLLLTKRPQNMAKMLPDDWGEGWTHVWLGTTAEDDPEAKRRIPHLLRTPAAVHYISYEPALGPLTYPDIARLDWVIAGGESGAKARPPQPEWFRAIRDQCVTAGVAFHFKQWGGRTPKSNGRLLDSRTWDEFPSTSSRRGVA